MVAAEYRRQAAYLRLTDPESRYQVLFGVLGRLDKPWCGLPCLDVMSVCF